MIQPNRSPMTSLAMMPATKPISIHVRKPKSIFEHPFTRARGPHDAVARGICPLRAMATRR